VFVVVLRKIIGFGWVTDVPHQWERHTPINFPHAIEVIIFVIYVWLSLYIGNGQTIGKRLMRTRVLSRSHERLSVWHALERSLGYGASFLKAASGSHSTLPSATDNARMIVSRRQSSSTQGHRFGFGPLPPERNEPDAALGNEDREDRPVWHAPPTEFGRRLAARRRPTHPGGGTGTRSANAPCFRHVQRPLTDRAPA
jgi:hypothetical protein